MSSKTTKKKKPTYEELEQRVNELEDIVSQLQDSEEKFRTIFESANDEILYLGVDGTIVEINDKGEDLFGFKREEVIGKNFADLGVLRPEDLKESIQVLKETIHGGQPKVMEFEAFRKDGTTIYIEGNARLIYKNGEVKGVLSILRDTTERKQIEKDLQNYRDHLEELVKDRTANLEEANTALKVLLKRREENKTELERNVLANMKELVLPFLEKLQNSKLNEKQKVFINIMEFNINDIISPFVQELSSKFLNLTATEIRIANIIKQGKSTKEIADMLNMSPRTIDLHRYNIRKKLGINKKKTSLATYLLSLK